MKNLIWGKLLLSSFFLVSCNSAKFDLNGGSVLLGGGGAHYQVQWDQPNLDLGEISFASTSSRTLQISNSGTKDVKACGNFELSDTTNFSIQSTNCSSELKTGESCHLAISIHPQEIKDVDLKIDRSCDDNVVMTNHILAKLAPPHRAKIIGGQFGDLATAEAYINSFKVGSAVTHTSYDDVDDIFEFASLDGNDFSKAGDFLGAGKINAKLEDPNNLLKIFAGNLFSGNTNTNYSLGDITATGAGTFNGTTGVNAKIKKYTFNSRGFSYVTTGVIEIDDAVGDGTQPKFVFNNSTRITINNDFVLNVGTHGRYTEFCDLRTNNWWYGYNVYDFKGNVTFDNVRNLIGGVGSKLWNATFYFRKDFNITNSNNLKVFKTIGQTQDNVWGVNHAYFYGKIGSTNAADFPIGTFGITNITYHFPASQQTSNAGGVEGDIQNIIDQGGTVLFDL